MWGALALAGVTTILTANPALFHVAKAAGAAYLAFLSVQFSRLGRAGTPLAARARARVAYRGLDELTQAFVMDPFAQTTQLLLDA